MTGPRASPEAHTLSPTTTSCTGTCATRRGSTPRPLKSARRVRDAAGPVTSIRQARDPTRCVDADSRQAFRVQAQKTVGELAPPLENPMR
ncbi:hypothetical protein PG997_013780 [Apiospora hydei]|uniref:Uncharacterized protein n=1 Tax=Apiospora hydei TaxID=1337664 RepID=A0ABR1V764_9PEZI